MSNFHRENKDSKQDFRPTFRPGFRGGPFSQIVEKPKDFKKTLNRLLKELSTYKILLFLFYY